MSVLAAEAQVFTDLLSRNDFVHDEGVIKKITMAAPPGVKQSYKILP